MVGGAYTHLDDMLASQYQPIDWTKHTTGKSCINWVTLWLLVPCMRSGGVKYLDYRDSGLKPH